MATFFIELDLPKQRSKKIIISEQLSDGVKCKNKMFHKQWY